MMKRYSIWHVGLSYVRVCTQANGMMTDSKGKEFGINKPDSMVETLAAHLGLLRLSFATASILQVILQQKGGRHVPCV